ncbi:MAG: flagellar biosynthesis anti-sigma factor FlgM [Acidobacteriia bacterium]|nr:flagellar biosynthesis anti-sigma factor FlgM [Terriglobia bacterium]
MKIKTGDATDASQINLDQARAPRPAGGADLAGSAAIGRSTAADSIALSSTKDLVQQALSAGSDARAARVLELKQQIESNQYRIDPLAVSRALIDAHLADG